MQRKALLLYLRELRDLEFAYWKVKKLYDGERGEFKKRYDKLIKTEDSMGPVKSDGWTIGRKRAFKICLMMSMLCMLILVMVVTVSENITPNPLLQGISIVGMLLFDGMAFGIYVRTENDQRERIVFLEKEKAKVASLLEKNYNLGIIPSCFQNIAAIYYIYDSISTSDASLEEILLRDCIENDIQCIVDSLDNMMNLNYGIIIQNRREEVTNQQILKANKEMLEQLEDMEEQASIATQYAEFSANYIEATAYFGLADYL